MNIHKKDIVCKVAKPLTIRIPLADVQLSVRAQVQPAVPAELEHDELRHQSAEVTARGFLVDRAVRIPGIVSVTAPSVVNEEEEESELVIDYDRSVSRRSQNSRKATCALPISYR